MKMVTLVFISLKNGCHKTNIGPIAPKQQPQSVKLGKGCSNLYNKVDSLIGYIFSKLIWIINTKS